jgi:hypothetical protein
MVRLEKWRDEEMHAVLLFVDNRLYGYRNGTIDQVEEMYKPKAITVWCLKFATQ